MDTGHLRDIVLDALKKFGHTTLQASVHVDRTIPTIDVLSWKISETGYSEPYLAVIINRDARENDELLLLDLARIRDALNTTYHYVFTGSHWFQANQRMTKLVSVTSPVQFDPPDAEHIVKDADYIRLILETRILTRPVASELEEEGASTDSTFFCALADALSDGIPLEVGTLFMDPKSALQEIFDTEAVSRRIRAFEEITHPSVARTMISILGNREPSNVLDPFLGYGTHLLRLWLANGRVSRLEMEGWEINQGVATVAHKLADSAGIPVAIRTGNSLNRSMEEEFDAVVCTPPWGRGLGIDKAQLLNGFTTDRLELSAIDIGIRNLKPGGRLVTHIPLGILRTGGVAEQYREFLSNHYRIGAIIGLPTGAALGTSIPSAILVIDKCEPGPTFVSQLSSDWENRLSSESSFMNALRNHLDSE